VLRSRRLALLPLAAALGTVAALIVAGAPSATGQTASPRTGKLGVGVEVLRFSAAGRKLTGTGLVTAKLTDQQGHTATVKTRVALAASTGGNCKVLHLFLKQLNLVLLGLNVHLDKVTLDITGDAKGGVLGSLFCKLTRAKVKLASAAAARALNARVSRRHRQALRFTATLTPRFTSNAASPTCPVLDLTLGPLNLQLLGLVVDLNKVHLTITATRGQGVLGDLFCQLADNTTTTTTTSTTTTG
jgi:hypothetical protein